MPTTQARRRDSISLRQKLAIEQAVSSLPNMPKDSTSLPPPVMAPLHPFVLPSGPKHLVFLSSLASRRFRSGLRPSFLGLFALLVLSAFCLLHQHLNDVPSLTFSMPPQPLVQTNSPPERPRHRMSIAKLPRPKIALAPAEELAAVIAFIAALPSNALPESVDPLLPIDPDLVLDFDTRTPNAALEVHDLVVDTWTRLPLVLLAKRYSPASREIKQVLSGYNLKPPPVVFEIDERADAPVLTPLIYRLTSTTDLPVLLVAGQPLGSFNKFRELHSSGELRNLILAGGAVIDGGAKKKKKGRRAVIP